MSLNREIPPVEAVKDDRARFALSAIKEQLEGLTGRRGLDEDRAVTVKDLVAAGLIELDNRGNVVRKDEDEQVDFKDQSLKTLETIIDIITTVDLPDPDIGIWSNAKQTAQNQLINEIKAKVNELIDSIRNGLFQ
jgi:hypothetical protein